MRAKGVVSRSARTTRARRARSANYYVVHPGNTPKNHPPTELRTLGPAATGVENSRLFAQRAHSTGTAHGAPPKWQSRFGLMHCFVQRPDLLQRLPPASRNRIVLRFSTGQPPGRRLSRGGEGRDGVWGLKDCVLSQISCLPTMVTLVWGGGEGTLGDPPPPCDIPSGCCSFTGPWTITRSSLHMLRPPPPAALVFNGSTDALATTPEKGSQSGLTVSAQPSSHRSHIHTGPGGWTSADGVRRSRRTPVCTQSPNV